jgi:hypothetical protein
MINLKQTYHLTTLILIVGLLVGPIHYLPSRPPVPSAQAQGAELAASGPYRTHVTFSGSAARARLDELGVVVLDEGPEGAVVLADDEQLETLARLRFRPHQTDSLDRLGFGGRVSALRVSAREILVLVPLDDTDADGLADTEETWWCTDPLDPDSDGDLVNDGAEVDALTDWLYDPRSGRPSSGKPFVGWPPDHTGCYDDDLDSVPDLAEIPIGLNQNLESSDRDKFDDGQELFGNTYCPGGGGACSYGYLPRDVDGGIVPPQMPSWVEAPGNHPLVAAFPEPEIEVVEDSLRVDRVTVITTEEGEMTQETHTYETAVTHGTSSSVADTVTWNEWQEVSVSTPQIARNYLERFALASEPAGFLPPELGAASAFTAFVGSWANIARCAGVAPGGPWAVAGCAGVSLLGHAVATVFLADAISGLGDKINDQSEQNKCATPSAQPYNPLRAYPNNW